MPKVAAALAAVLLAFAAGAAGAAPPSHARPFRHLRFSQVPEQVQRDLVAYLGKCQISAELVRRGVLVDAGPFGGPGRTDYYFQYQEPYLKLGWFPPADAPACFPGNFQNVTMIWMRRATGDYTFIVRINVYPYLGPGPTLFWSQTTCPDPDVVFCSAMAVWDERLGDFRRVSNSQFDEDTYRWAAAHRYRRYRYAAEGRD